MASCLYLLAAGAFAKEPVDYVNTEIGTISHMLVPCFQTTQLPNATLGGKPLAGTAIPHSALLGGETLRLEMTSE